MGDDLLGRHRPVRRWTTAVGYSLASLAFLGTAFAMGPGSAQLACLALGAFFVAGPAGAAGAVVTGLTPESIRATALGTLALANNLLGLAAGPVVVVCWPIAWASRDGLRPAGVGLPEHGRTVRGG